MSEKQESMLCIIPVSYENTLDGFDGTTTMPMSIHIPGAMTPDAHRISMMFPTLDITKELTRREYYQSFSPGDYFVLKSTSGVGVFVAAVHGYKKEENAHESLLVELSRLVESGIQLFFPSEFKNDPLMLSFIDDVIEPLSQKIYVRALSEFKSLLG